MGLREWDEKKSVGEMRIIIAGDFTTEGRGLDAVQKHNAIAGDICNILCDSDYNVVNLEAPVADHESVPIIKSGPHLKTDAVTISYLKNVGFHAVTLANNHFCDYGIDGVRLTCKMLEECGLSFVGGGRDSEEYRKTIYYKGPDSTIAILNYCEHEFSIQNDYGSNPLDAVRCLSDIRGAREKVDVVLVIVHGGHEGYNLPSPRMQDTYRFLIDCGADVVINHHQHCYSGYEAYHNGYIYYGLGNFFFDAKGEGTLWTEGFFVSIDVQQGKVREIKSHPYEQCQEKATVRLMDEQKSIEFEQKITKLNEIIANRAELEKHFDEFCYRKRKNYTIVLAPYTNRILCALSKRNLLPSFITNRRKKMLLNYVRCESHRDVLIKSLQNLK